MTFQLYKYFLSQSRKILIAALAGFSVYAVLLLETKYPFVIALMTYFVGNYFLSLSRDNHKILGSLPLKRSQIIIASYLAYTSIILLVNLMIVGVYFLLASMLNNPKLSYPSLYLFGFIYLAIALAVVRKCLYDYFGFYGAKSLLITIPIMLFLILSLAIGTKAVEHFNIISANYFMFSTGTIILLIIFLVTKRYYLRLDL